MWDYLIPGIAWGTAGWERAKSKMVLPTIHGFIYVYILNGGIDAIMAFCFVNRLNVIVKSTRPKI